MTVRELLAPAELCGVTIVFCARDGYRLDTIYSYQLKHILEENTNEYLDMWVYRYSFYYERQIYFYIYI